MDQNALYLATTMGASRNLLRGRKMWESGKVEKWGLVKPCKWNTKSMETRERQGVLSLRFNQLSANN